MMALALRISASKLVPRSWSRIFTTSRKVPAATTTPPANEEEETGHCSEEPQEDFAADTGILVNVSELAVNATFYRRRVERGEVRILTIHPARYSDPLSCTLQEYDIRQVPEYTAISYCWTYDADLVCIGVDDSETFKVPVHLRACLRRLRSATSAIRVWIDAICINQNDQVEKSEQVGQMPKIYSGSLRTAIWLGETEPDAPTCIVRANGYCAIEGFSSVEHGGMLHFLGRFLKRAEKVSLRPEAEHLMRVWWKRLWCIQEFMLSPRVPKVMAGPHLVRWHDFVALTGRIISPLFRPSLNSLFYSSPLDPLSSDHDSDHWQSPSREKSLFELLRITSQDFACSDPKDRIFALIGISNDADVSIQVDYARTTEEVYTEATEYFISTEGNVDMLLDERASRLNGSLPTWIPEFATIKTIKEAGTPDAFRASSEKPVTEVIHWEPSIPCGCTGSCLKLRAIKFDNIVRRVAIVAFSSWDTLTTSSATIYQTYGLDFSRIRSSVNYFEAVSSGGNSNDFERFGHSSSTEIKPKRKRGYSSQTRDQDYSYTGQCLYEEYSFVDCILEALAVDFAQAPLLNLERLPQIGLILLDYLFNGTQSLEKVMKYYHGPKFGRCRHWIGDWRLARAQLVQRHRLPDMQAFSYDLEVALEIQRQVLGKVAKKEPWPDLDKKNREIPESTWSPDSGYERVFFKTDDQHLGVGPGDLQIGDEVVVPFGSSRPWVLRSHGDHHVLVGEAFVPGIMTGQLEELWRRGDLGYTDYVLR